MLWVSRADPGQITIADGEPPKHTHKSWLYPEPIRCYDLYCRWLQNVVSLMNHREFMAMLIGLTLSCLGLQKARVQIVTDVILVFHWIYSLVSLFFEGEIFIILVGLISRNETVETTQEWKQNKHDVARETSKGNNIHVESLPDSDDYNELLDNGEFVHSQRQTPLTKAARRTVSTSGVSHDGTAKQRGTSEPRICASGSFRMDISIR